ncbi:LysO family transporter [Prolixibacter sp. NT017]|uniref:LysO family transporter n=1 Tax=Prolixibacter sp. NT017 TaxID=2652390 RepID=UPI00129930DE|nr:LysO family transporter [Prolixibacter sp. NT017]
MITVLLLMVAGILAGLWLGKFPSIMKVNDRLISWAIYLLLFLLGVSVGTNEKVIQSLDSIGLQALLLTVGALAGSIATGWIIYRVFFHLDNN